MDHGPGDEAEGAMNIATTSLAWPRIVSVEIGVLRRAVLGRQGGHPGKTGLCADRPSAHRLAGSRSGKRQQRQPGSGPKRVDCDHDGYNRQQLDVVSVRQAVSQQALVPTGAEPPRVRANSMDRLDGR